MRQRGTAAHQRSQKKLNRGIFWCHFNARRGADVLGFRGSRPAGPADPSGTLPIAGIDTNFICLMWSWLWGCCQPGLACFCGLPPGAKMARTAPGPKFALASLSQIQLKVQQITSMGIPWFTIWQKAASCAEVIFVICACRRRTGLHRASAQVSDRLGWNSEAPTT